MGYRHKRESCSRQTKEILDDILKLKNAEYEITDGTQTVFVSSPIEKIVTEEVDANVLPSRTRTILDKEAGDKVEVPRTCCEEGEGTEHYETTLDIKYPVKHSDELYMKKRKRANRLDERGIPAEF